MNDQSGLVSVIIPCYNSAATIEPCLRSIEQSSYPHLEVIVVDDCSTDHSPALLSNLSTKGECKVPLRMAAHQTNSGPAKARNSGAKVARGSYLFFLDSDVEVEPETIQIAITEMERLAADAITGIYDGRPANSGVVPAYKAAFNFYHFARRGIIPYEVFDSSRACIKKDVFTALGGFNESLRWGMDYENEEFGYRLTEQFKNYLVPAVKVRHHFPHFKKLTKTYFLRVSLWFHIFMQRKKFENGGITSNDIGVGTAMIVPAIFFALLAPLNPWSLVLATLFSLLYGKCYWGFYRYLLAQHSTATALTMILLNLYFSLVITSGAVWGLGSWSASKARQIKMG